MTLTKIVEQYIISCIINGEANETGNYRKANKHFDKINQFFGLLKKEGELGIEELRKLMTHPNNVVKMNASTHMLIFDEKVAKQNLLILEELKLPFVSFTAEMVLEEWENGNLKDYLNSL